MPLYSMIWAVMLQFLSAYASKTDEFVAALVIVAGALLLSLFLRRLINRLCRSQYMAPIMAGRLQTFLRLTIFSVTVLILMQVLGLFNSAWAMISAALAAVAIGFIAAWSMLSNATAALLVLTFRPFRLGDMVELLETNGTGVGGRVIDINLMYTTLSVPSDEEEENSPPQLLQIPNNLFFQKILRTRSAHEPDSKASFFSPRRRGGDL